MIKKLLISLSLFFFLQFGIAGEGMWLPLLLNQLNEGEMQQMGMKITAEDIYSVNKGSLKDAIVHFGGFCTGEIVSDQGLVMTNFHCGKGQVQSHSSLENNYLEKGFWASSMDQELPNQRLFVRFIIRIEDVTKATLKGVKGDLSESERQSAIDKNLQKVRSDAEIEEHQEIVIRPFFNGNQYFLFVTETYRDVRLVGAPPTSIGEYGKDTDNWIWPRHTGDFSLFRVYAGPDNKPAAYSPDNKPYKPRHFLPISLDGVSEGDFTMIFGFPGRTNQYLPSPAIEMQADVLNPVRVSVRDRSLAVIDAAMRADEEVRIQYASKQAGIANYWKKWIGESAGIKRTGGIVKKEKFEEEFTKRIMSKNKWKKAYEHILPEFERLYAEQKPYAITRSYLNEIVGNNIELFRFASTLNGLINIYKNNGEQAMMQRLGAYTNFMQRVYADYRPEIDQEVFAAVMEAYFTEVPKEHLAPFAMDQLSNAGGSYEQLAKNVFQQSMLAKSDKVLQALDNNPLELMKDLENDLAIQLVREILRVNNEMIMLAYNQFQDQIDLLQRRYMKAQMEVFPEKRFFPDANSTLRVSYGNVEGFKPRDAVRYEPVTYFSGVIEKYKPDDYEFDLPEKLLSLYEHKDYGPYAADNGKLPVCFIDNTHITGGNSGSPTIDANGNLVGLAFDGNWEGTMGDISYDPSLCRTITVDIRYVLFIIDKFAGADNIIKELTLVRPKS